ncbi:hypothetical protein Pcinc_037676 [Petrolisthes cinctipes]|uniref:Uncharacterized protein n=1 Tax=Petrolisthes cinctipes TaxID=88211 RepID=A0AAE1BSD1_PETCI|nr:hypothetical protein Pcinc_037676 [Petrolisthes cinctipes]
MVNKSEQEQPLVNHIWRGAETPPPPSASTHCHVGTDCFTSSSLTAAPLVTLTYTVRTPPPLSSRNLQVVVTSSPPLKVYCRKVSDVGKRDETNNVRCRSGKDSSKMKRVKKFVCFSSAGNG